MQYKTLYKIRRVELAQKLNNTSYYYIFLKEMMDTILFLHVFQSRKNKTERTIAATFASGSSDHTTTNAEPVKTKLLEQEVAEQVHSSVIAEPKRYNDPHPSH